MAFKPKSENSYNLIVKHSQLALSIPPSPPWAQVEQHPLKTLGHFQEFRFEQGEYWYRIMPEFNHRFLAVHASSQDESIPVIRYERGGGGNFMFQFVYGKEGYYYVRALHSGKYFDIFRIVTTAGGQLTQHSLHGGDNQLFRPVLIPGKSGIPGKSFVEVNEDVRTIALGLISQVPEVGGGLSKVVGHFWTAENKMQNLWDQMKDYVELRINQRITEERILRLESVLKSLIKEIRKIDKSTESDRGTRILGEISAAQREEGLLFDGSQAMLPYIVVFGTVIVGLHKTLLTNYAEFYKHTPTPDQIRTTKEELDDTISVYSTALSTGRKSAMDARMACIKNRVTNKIVNRDEIAFESIVEDTFDGWRQVWDYRTLLEDGRESGSFDHEARADFAVEQRRNQIREQYASTLDEFALAGEEWQYVNPDKVRPTGVKRVRTVGIFGPKDVGPQRIGAPANNTSPISKVILHTDNKNEFCGIEVFYGGNSSGFCGKRGSEHTLSLDTANGEYISGAYGISWRKIKSLTLNSCKGKTETAGNPKYRSNDELFTADLADGLDSRLVEITGTADANCVLQLSFKWEFSIKDPK
ncbi:MAG: RICIN domain-containing protein [Bacteroidota bacterium]